MNWINGFEVMCYAITVMLLLDILIRKRQNELLLFISASIAGFALELLAVRVTGIYHYSSRFFINVGIPPYQFPFFGGVMWGGLSVCSRRLAGKLSFSPLMEALVGGWLIVTMDLLLDVAAIRLDGGFWVWDGRIISLEISHHMFMSVIWVNFLGYLFETPAVLFFTRRYHESSAYRKHTALKKILMSAGIGALGIVIVGVSSGISLGLNMITDEWFACIAFVCLWGYIFIRILWQAVRFQPEERLLVITDVPSLVYWGCMYLYCLLALAYLGIAGKVPAFFIFGIMMFLGTIWLCLAKGKEK